MNYRFQVHSTINTTFINTASASSSYNNTIHSNNLVIPNLYILSILFCAYQGVSKFL